MTDETFKRADNLKKDIEHLELKRKQAFDFDKILKERKPSPEEQSLFLNSMINIIDSLNNIKKEQFKSL